jgi:hypothetical protein
MYKQLRKYIRTFKGTVRDMDLAESDINRQVFFLKGKARVFSKNPPAPHPLRALKSFPAPPCSWIANLEHNCDVGQKNSLRSRDNRGESKVPCFTFDN